MPSINTVLSFPIPFDADTDALSTTSKNTANNWAHNNYRYHHSNDCAVVVVAISIIFYHHFVAITWCVLSTIWSWEIQRYVIFFPMWPIGSSCSGHSISGLQFYSMQGKGIHEVEVRYTFFVWWVKWVLSALLTSSSTVEFINQFR